MTNPTQLGAMMLTDEEIVEAGYMHTVETDEPLFQFDRKELIAMVRELLSASKPAAPAQSGQPVAWQWRKKSDPWTLEKTFNSEVFATTDDSEVRPLYAAPQPSQPAQAGDEGTS